MLVALVEVGFWINALTRMDFDRSSATPNFDQQTTWFSDLGVSYHVGFYAFSFWLAGLAVVVMAAAIAYGFWVGRERPRAYFGLMLFLTSAVVGVFASQDLLLFYVFFEAMMIPLYVLIGVWGGPGRLGATVKFVIYTMAGSLLMLAAVIVFGLSKDSFDLVDTGPSNSTWLFLGFAIAFAVKAPLFPLHGWLPDAYRESSPEVAAVLSGVISKAAIFGFIRICFGKFPGPFDDFRNVILALAVVGLVYGSLLAFRAPDIRGVIAYSSLAQMGLITIGVFAENTAGVSGAVLQSVNHGLISATLFLLAGAIERRTSTGLFSRLGGMARGRPALATVADGDRSHRPRGAGIVGLCRRVPDPGRRLQLGLGLGRRRRHGNRARRDVHAPPDLGGPAQGARACRPGGCARPAPGRARHPRPARRLPARALGVACGDQRSLENSATRRPRRASTPASSEQLERPRTSDDEGQATISSPLRATP